MDHFTQAPLILLVEDDPEDVFFALRAAQQAGVTSVEHVIGGERAKQRLCPDDPANQARPWPSVILTDLNMPGCDGIELLKWLRAREETKHILVIILSSSFRESDQETAYAAGANAYLIKPNAFSDYEAMWKSVLSIAASTSRGSQV